MVRGRQRGTDRKPLEAQRQKIIVGVYCRASPAGDASLIEQEREGIAYALSHDEDHWSYMDLRDGYSLDRPGLNSLKADIERRKISKVRVADLTRLSRDPAVLESIKGYLVLHNVELLVAG